MSKRKKARPISKGVPYTIPGHVIGGREPTSWKVTKESEKAERLVRQRPLARPRASGPTIEAKFESECYWCGEPIAKGAKITSVEIQHRRRWIHERCAD